MDRLEQDAAEVMAWHEFKASERARWAKANQPAPTKTVRFTITEQERLEREQQIQAGLLPF